MTQVTPATQNLRADRLYDLLPVIYRMRDAAQQHALRDLLRVIAEQVNVVEDDIAQLYDNWFIETAQDWAVPYIGDLIGYRPVNAAGSPGDPSTAQGAALNRILAPRREVANTIRYRRRKGTLALLALLAQDVADWPARAVEFYSLLGWTQHVNHLHTDRHRLMDVRNGYALDALDTPFDPTARMVDVRGTRNLVNVGVFAWRLKSYAVTHTPACCLEESGPQCYTFSVLGNDAPLFTAPQTQPISTQIAGPLNVPDPIRRRVLERDVRAVTRGEKPASDYYGQNKSLSIWVSDWSRYRNQEIPVKAIIVADLSGWHYRPQRDHIVVDPVLGRIVFPTGQLPKGNVRVSYHYGFSADIGGGEYDRPLSQPNGAKLYRVSARQNVGQNVGQSVGATGTYDKIADAVRAWQSDADRPQHAVIEIIDSDVYVEQLVIRLERDQSLQIRAANRKRPVVRLLDFQTDRPDALSVELASGSSFVLDGLLIMGRAVNIRRSTEPVGLVEQVAPVTAAQPSPGDPTKHAGTGTGTGTGDNCAAQVAIRHCTLVPGWGLQSDCQPKRPAEPSLELYNVRAGVVIEHSIVGSIQVDDDEVTSDPMPIRVSDSIMDATSGKREAIGSPNTHNAHVVMTVQRCTVFGIVQVHAFVLAENSIFMDCVHVARRQLGCMRFCYVPPGCRTPKRYNCQPDLVVRAVRERVLAGTLTGLDETGKIAREATRVQPRFTSRRYGMPGYGQLGESCADEIKRGADDESEMGAFHDLFQPQREANLRTRLNEFMPSGMSMGLMFAS